MTDILLPGQLLTVGACALTAFVVVGAACGMVAAYRTTRTAQLSRWAWGETNTRLTLLEHQLEAERARMQIVRENLAELAPRILPEPSPFRPHLSVVRPHSGGRRAVAPPLDYTEKGG